MTCGVKNMVQPVPVLVGATPSNSGHIDGAIGYGVGNFLVECVFDFLVAISMVAVVYFGCAWVVFLARMS